MSTDESSQAMQEMMMGVQLVVTATSTVADVSSEATKEADEGMSLFSVLLFKWIKSMNQQMIRRRSFNN